MGDEDAGDVDLVVQAPEPVPELLADLGIDRAEGLVEQQHPGLGGERPGECDPLALAAGELRGVAVPEALQAHQGEELGDPRGLALAPGALDVEPEGDVLGDRHVAEERVVLEHEPDAPGAGVQVVGAPAVEPDLAGIGRFEAGDDAQDGALAAPGGAEEGDELAARDLQRDVVDGEEVVEALGEVADVDAHGLNAPGRAGVSATRGARGAPRSPARGRGRWRRRRSPGAPRGRCR